MNFERSGQPFQTSVRHICCGVTGCFWGYGWQTSDSAGCGSRAGCMVAICASSCVAFPLYQNKEIQLSDAKRLARAVAGLLYQRCNFFHPNGIKNRANCKCIWCLFVAPVVSYGISYLFMREAVSRSKTFLLFVGFSAVFMVVQPGIEMSHGILLALLAGCCYGSYLATTRLVARGISGTASAYVTTDYRVYYTCSCWNE